MALSVDGLVTGMNTTDTVAQLMQVEAIPQTQIKNKITVANQVVSAYQSVNTRLASLAIAANAAGSADTWAAMNATSNSSAAVVSTHAGASAGSLSFRVEQLASTHLMTFAAGSAVASASDATGSPVMSGSTFDVVLNDGSTKTLTPTDQSLQAVVTAINGEANVSYKASAVQIGPGKYTLQLTAKASGAVAAAAVAAAGAPTGLNLGAATVTAQGDDARLKIGNTADAYAVTSATNTFTDVLPGLTVTAVSAQAVSDPDVTIQVSADADGIAAKVQAMVDNANVALNEIASQNKVKTGDVDAGPLVGDNAMRTLSQDILGAVSGGADGLGTNGGPASYNQAGVSVDRNGAVTFDKAAFLAAYAADPVTTQKLFEQKIDKAGGTADQFDPGFDTAVGLGRKLAAISLIASEGVVNPTNPTKAKVGTLQALIQRNTDTIKDLNDQVSLWDVRLDLRKTALNLQFTNLEVAMGKMKSQSSWLAGQLASLG
ncbi:MAG: flagellar hook-associated protein 2 [Actinoplanes sp.]|jgi:flagellar hook-associated protein 2|nr:flagellar hook-associated protein 2 [Actinoplanes sp.]